MKSEQPSLFPDYAPPSGGGVSTMDGADDGRGKPDFYVWSFRHHKTGKTIYPKNGRPFPMWKKRS